MNGYAALVNKNSPYSLNPDFNHDGKTDLIWRNFDTGENVVWYMNGGELINGEVFFNSRSSALGFGAAVDFDGDGVTDLHWNYHSLTPPNQATAFITLMRGDVGINWQAPDTRSDAIKRQNNLPAAPRPWEAVGAGDFNGDGKPDLFWRNRETNENVVWYVDNGGFIVGRDKGEALPGVVSGGWDVRGIADINRDGKPDMVWRNLLTGENVIWLMDGLVQSSGYFLPPVGDLAWHLEAVADLSNDGIPDLIWRNYKTGENVAWYLNEQGQYTGTTYAILPRVAVGSGWKLGGRAEFSDGVPNPINRK